jgi:MFS family permease
MAAMGFGGALYAALTGAMALLPASLLLIGLWIVRPLAGITNAPLHPGAARVVSLWFPASLSSMANGAVTAGALLGIAAVPIVFGKMMDRFGLPLAFVIAGAATTILALLWTFYGSDKPSTASIVSAIRSRCGRSPGAGSRWCLRRSR